MQGIVFRGQATSRPQALLCKSGRLSASPAPRAQFARSYTPFRPLPHKPASGQLQPRSQLKSPRSPIRPFTRRFASSTSHPPSTSDAETALRQVEEQSAQLLKLDSPPPNESVVHLLQKCQEIAESLVLPERDPTSSRKEDSEISSLLNLEEKNQTRKRSSKPAHSKNSAPTQLAHSVSQAAHDLLTDEKVFISPEALTCYTKIQTLLNRPELFPEIFYMYANKPVPEENSSPIKYLKANPKNINSAIPVDVANMALDVAIEHRNLPLVLAIIDNTFCAPAFHRAKLFKKAAVPMGGLAAAPAACYVVASWAASLQDTMDPSTATGIAFAATLAYVGGTSSVGLLAITTANDQMERVVWQPGIPLRHRWLREEERAALDKVALAWGFKDEYMRGEEEGEEWDSLREFIGMRGMILDKTDLMQGMQ